MILMFDPVIVNPPAADVLPITVEAVKLALRVDADLDDEIERLIRSAVDHYEGRTGILGVYLVQQTWRQAFSSFEQVMPLALRPFVSVSSVSYRNSAGQSSTIVGSEYEAVVSSNGSAALRFRDSFSAPSDLYEFAPVLIEYVVGWPEEGGNSGIPKDIQTAIILHVQKHLDEAARSNWDILDRAEKDLIYKYRKPI